MAQGPRRLYRNTQDKKLAGICSGIADYFDTDPVLVRLIAVLVLFASGGTAILAYLVGIFVVPEKPIDPKK